MKVITFNIRCKDDQGGNSIAERAPRLKTILDKYDADIFVVVGNKRFRMVLLYR